MHALSHGLALLVVRLATTEEQRVRVFWTNEKVVPLDGVKALLPLALVRLSIPRACAEESSKAQTTSGVGVASVERIHAGAVCKYANAISIKTVCQELSAHGSSDNLDED